MQTDRQTDTIKLTGTFCNLPAQYRTTAVPILACHRHITE